MGDGDGESRTLQQQMRFKSISLQPFCHGLALLHT